MPLLLLVASLLARSIDDRASDRAYIHQAESDWAESVATNDVGILERILADDFVGVDIDGSHYYKAGAMKDYRSGPSSFLSDHLNEVGGGGGGGGGILRQHRCGPGKRELEEKGRNCRAFRLDRHMD